MNKNWRYVIGAAAILIFGARIYFSIEQKKEREKQQQMLDDLSRMQSEQFRQNYEKNMDSISASLMPNLDSIQKGLDSIGKKLTADQKAFEEKMKK